MVPGSTSVIALVGSTEMKPKQGLGLEAENHVFDVNNCMALRAKFQPGDRSEGGPACEFLNPSPPLSSIRL
jgi:hypothetical protein